MLGVDDFKAHIHSSGGLARSNLYMVELPPIEVPGVTMASYDLNIICKSTQLPGRQILTHERKIGVETVKVAYGFSVDDITLTFHVMNDYKIKKYFDAWMELSIENNSYGVGYHKNYAKNMAVKQLRKGLSFPIWKNNIDFLDDVPSNIKNRLKIPDIPGLGETGNRRLNEIIDLSQGEIDITLVGSDAIMYDCRLRDAFPTSVTSIDMGDGNANGLVELTVAISYTNWYNRKLEESVTLGSILAKLGIF